ncbi:MAG: hypothetical protein ACRCSG_08240 [Cellulosilyticaceae bacterium]
MKREENGVTIVEVIISLALVMIIIQMLWMSNSFSMKTYKKSRNKQEAYSCSNVLSGMINDEIIIDEIINSSRDANIVNILKKAGYEEKWLEDALQLKKFAYHIGVVTLPNTTKSSDIVVDGFSQTLKENVKVITTENQIEGEAIIDKLLDVNDFTKYTPLLAKKASHGVIRMNVISMNPFKDKTDMASINANGSFVLVSQGKERENDIYYNIKSIPLAGVNPTLFVHFPITLELDLMSLNASDLETPFVIDNNSGMPIIVEVIQSSTMPKAKVISENQKPVTVYYNEQNDKSSKLLVVAVTKKGEDAVSSRLAHTFQIVEDIRYYQP